MDNSYLTMIEPSYLVTLALLLVFLAMALVVILLARTTRKVVDKNTALSEKLLEKDMEAVPLVSPVEQIKKDLSGIENPSKMSDAQLMTWIDGKMEELALYQQADLDLKTVSETLGVSQRHLLRIFKDQPQYGSFSGYLTEKRLAKACSLLKSHPEYTIEAICLDAGFRTRRTFQTVFKARLGISPSEYRSAVQKEHLTK